jgi:hypothetical protein
MSGQPPQPTPQQAMEHHVGTAQARLNDGALVRETLEYLWRVAFAAGVRMGQAPPARNANARVTRIADNEREGWRYGTPWVHMDLKPGDRFVYGGVDQEGPNCDRQALMLPAGDRGSRMQLADTGETVRVPSVCWTRPEGNDGDGG